MLLTVLACGEPPAETQSVKMLCATLKVGMQTSEAEKIMGGAGISSKLIQQSGEQAGSGHLRYWGAPLDITTMKQDIYRGIVPYGDVCTAKYNTQNKLTEITLTFISEASYQEKVKNIKEQTK